MIDKSISQIYIRGNPKCKEVRNLKIILKNSVKTRLMIAKKGESLRTFSSRIGISQGYLSQILSMKKNPSASVAYKITKGLNVEMEEIFLLKMNDISISEEEGQEVEANC